MPQISMHSDEKKRLAALRNLGVLDTPPDEALDGLVKTASLICGTPIALVSLVDEHRQWFKANHGLDGVSEMPRGQAFCQYTIQYQGLLEVPDALADIRFSKNPLVVGDLNIRFYAGVPLRLSNGYQVGSLCVIDRQVRRLTPEQREILSWLGQAAAAILDQYNAVRRLRETVVRSDHIVEELSRQYDLLQTTLHSIGDGVITADRFGLTVWLNPVAERLTGWITADAIGRKVSEVYVVADQHTGLRVACPVDLCLDSGGVAYGSLATSPVRDNADAEQRRPRVLVGRGDERYEVEDLASPIRSDLGEISGVVLVIHDVTEQRWVTSEMAYRATHDPLTGLLNRSEFEVRLRQSLDVAHTNNTQGSILFIDLDQFKLVNDACGHAAGDCLLVQVSKMMSNIVRSGDTVSRLGGDEFAIILDGCPPHQAHGVAQAICDLLENYRFDYDGQRFRVGASIGLVPVDARWPAIAGIMQAADDSCYAAKNEGRNRVHVWSDSDQTMRDRQSEMKWATRLTAALDEDHFELFIQRILPLQTDKVGIHAEILLRLREADGSLSPPGIFIPASERFHLASQIDRWVLRRAIDWMNGIAIGAVEMLCINLSGQSVGDRAFHRWAIGILEAAGPEICCRLCVEITETVAVTNLTDASMFIHQIRKIGVSVALDDFGAGASSFGYLKTLPVDFLKIDGQFVRDIVTDALDQAAVRCFVDVALLMGIKTVAEYVDDPDVLQILRTMGVDFAQGFLIHKPVPIAELFVPLEVNAWSRQS